MDKIRIIGLLIYDRIKEAGQTQKILTKYGHIIKTRLGFHEVTNEVCSRDAIILLEITGNKQQFENLEKELLEVGGIKLQKMTFDM